MLGIKPQHDKPKNGRAAWLEPVSVSIYNPSGGNLPLSWHDLYRNQLLSVPLPAKAPPAFGLLQAPLFQTCNSPPATAESVSFKHIAWDLPVSARVVHVALTPNIIIPASCPSNLGQQPSR
ncbi:hypothetical protein NXS19_005528 [Fusarium pseudograminearum]|nr:hypothetical protein NXS19_005528 [Fusarium pseudograminearum]